MRHFWGIWVLLLIIAALFGWGFNGANSETQAMAPVPFAMELSFSPGNVVKQGAIVLVHIKNAAMSFQDLVAKLDGETTKFEFFKEPSGFYQGVIGISVDMDPGKHVLTIETPSGKTIVQKTLTILDARFPKQNIIVSKNVAGLEPSSGEIETIHAFENEVTPTLYWNKPFISPTSDCENSTFGVKRYHNGVYAHEYHKGVDLRSPFGRPIRAVNDGVVALANPTFRLDGGTVGIDHGQGLGSIYIHMSRIVVKKGEKVKKGEIIGYVGSSGFATGPHLHWGLYAFGIPVNPNQWIHVARCR